MNDVAKRTTAWTPDGETQPKPTEDAIIAAIVDGVRSGNPGEHLRTRPDLRDRDRRRRRA